MASTFTTLGIEKMATGENAGTWGDKTNTNLDIVNTAVSGYVEQAVTNGGTLALSITDGASTATAQNAVIKLTGTITGNSIVTVPDSVEKVYIVTNGTSGAYTVQFKTASGTGVTFGVSEKTTKLLYSDGTNIVDAGFSGALDIEGRELVLDADGDTTITADTDDQIDIKIAGADDFQFTANTFTAQAGSTIAAQALTATTVTASGIVKTDDTTEATSTTDGSLQTDGGLSVAKDAVLGDDLKLLSDSAVLSFGADSDTTLTHTDGTGLTLNSTNKFLFRDTGLYINSSTDGQLDIVADTEIQIAATTIDINGAVAMDGAITGATNITLSGELDAATGDFSGDVDIDGTLEADAITINGTAIGSIYGAVAGSSSIVTTGALDSGSITSGFGTIDTGSSTITTTGLISGGSLDIDNVLINGTTIGHTDDTDLMTVADGVLTVAGELDATTLDISGNADIDGTTNLDAVDIDGAVQLDATLTVGADDQGYDVKLFGDTASAYMLWDTSADDLILGGAAGLIVPDGQFTLGSTAVTSTAAEINLIDGGTARGTTAVADADGILHNDGGTMRMTSAATFKTYFQSGSGVAADDISAGDAAVTIGNGSTSADVTLDSGDDIVIDAAGGNVEFKDAGTLQLTLDMDGTAGAQVVQLGVDSDDLIFKQYDGTTVLTLDDDTTVKVATDLTVGDDVTLLSDAAVLKFGADAEVTLTHVHNDGLLLNTDMQLQFRDSAINIRSDADGDLDINADDEVEINSTLIDVNGNLDVSGTLAQAGVATFSVAANVAQVALSSSSNAVAWDASAAANAYHLTTENTTFSAPSNAVEGAFICVEINYNGSHTIAWNTVFEFAASTAFTATSTDAKTDIIVFRYNGAVWQEVGRTLNLSES